MSSAPSGLRRCVGALGVVLLAAAWFTTGSVAHAQTPAVGELRLGHLSPTTPAVDIYLTAPGAPSSQTPLVRDAGYGAVTPYQDLAPGRYTVEMRAAGASPDTAAPLTSAVDVAPGSAQSLLFFDTGAAGAVQGQLLDDDLTTVVSGSGRIRIVQGAAGIAPVHMQAVGGPRLATELRYGTVTDYSTVAARVWNVAVDAGDKKLQATLDVADGSVSTVVLTSDPAGALVATPLVDVAGSPAALDPGSPLIIGPPVEAPGSVPADQPSAARPRGGVPAGGGGAAEGADPLPMLVGLAGALLVVLATTGVPARRVRRRG